MKIGDLDLNKDILIIAEIGNNHEGSYALAEEMIGLAAKAGANAVKFQTIVPDKLISVKEKSRIQQLEKFRLSYAEFEKLSKVAEQEKILFLSTPFDIESARFLNPLVDCFKISSGDNDFFPLIEVIARTGKPVILSSGMADIKQIRTTKNFIERIWKNKNIKQELAILHCVVNYPTDLANANLLAIRQLRELGVTVGYSDHTIGIEAAVLSVALGARIIEKHFTISKDYSGFRDHQLSADPAEFSELVKRVKDAVKILGDGKKRILDSERPMVQKVRRSIAASRDLKKGTIIALSDIIWVRPGIGMRPGEERKILNKKLFKPVSKGTIILPKDVADKI